MPKSPRIPEIELVDAEKAEIDHEEVGRNSEGLDFLAKTLRFLQHNGDVRVIGAFNDENIFFTGTEIGQDPLSLPPEERRHALIDHFDRYHPHPEANAS